jgi:AcrR family transcriptional regulator
MARTVGSQGAKTEETIRTAAKSLIASRGFEAVTLRQIASEAGIQSGALYRYFPSKTDLLLTLLVEHMERLLESWSEARPNSKNATVLLHAFIDFHIRYHTSKQKDVFIAYMELRSLPPKEYETVAELRARYENELKDILAKGAAEKQFQILDIDVATYGIIAMLTGVCTWFREDGRLSKSDLVTCYRTLVLQGVGASSNIQG